MNRKISLSVFYFLSVLLAVVLSTCSAGAPEADDGDGDAVLTGQELRRAWSLPVPLFAGGSAWNARVAGAAVLANSDQQMTVLYRVLLGDTSTLHPSGPPPTTWPFPDVNYDAYAVPIFRAGAGQQDVVICDYEGNLGWPHAAKFPDSKLGGPVTIPSPDGGVRPAGPQDIGADGHLVLYDPATHTEYDLWQATTVRSGLCQSAGGGREGTVIYEAGAVDFFALGGQGTNPDGYSSARATGVPLLAGLILPEDVEGGVIAHALAVAIPGLRNTSGDPSTPIAADYFYPASTTETDFYNTNPNALAAGQRLVLKQAIVDDRGDLLDEGSLAPITRMFLAALRDYGAYVVDNAGGFTFYAEDIHSAILDLTDGEVIALIGETPGYTFPAGKTRWQVVLEKLNQDLERIPVAFGPDGQTPASAEFDTVNFEVVAAAGRAAYLPLVTREAHSSLPPAVDQVAYWAYQIQGLSRPGMVDALAASHYDMLVLEPTRTDWSSDDRHFDTRAMVARLKASYASDGVHRKLIIAYIDIGEAEDWRWYWTWSLNWDCQGDPPADWPGYILICDPDGWGGNYPVAYWDAGWRDIVIYGQNQSGHPDRDYASVLGQVIQDGFDGVYLDWVEGYENERVAAKAQAAGKDAAAEMVAFVQEIRDYALARNPNFVIIQQNAAALIDGHPQLLSAIDALAQESVWYDGDATDRWDDVDGYDWPNDVALTDYYTGYLDRYLAAGVPVFVCEYALSYANMAYGNALSRGYVPYVTRRSLGMLTGTTPPGY